MKKYCLITLASLFLLTNAANAGVPTADIAATVQRVLQIITQLQQYATLGEQLAAVTGGRGFSNLGANIMQQYIDMSWYDQLNNMNSGLTNEARSMKNSLGIKTDCSSKADDLSKKICEMQLNSSLNNYAALQKANKTSLLRNDEISILRGMISLAGDSKAAEELNALINTLNSSIGNNGAQAQLASEVNKSNDALLEQLGKEQFNQYVEKSSQVGDSIWKLE